MDLGTLSCWKYGGWAASGCTGGGCAAAGLVVEGIVQVKVVWQVVVEGLCRWWFNYLNPVNFLAVTSSHKRHIPDCN